MVPFENQMSELENFIDLSIREFRRLKKLSDDAVKQISEDQFFQTLGEGDNSAALIYKHMAGNMLSRWKDFLTTDGEKEWRNRDSEFEIVDTDRYEDLIGRWEESWAVLFSELAALKPEDLSRTVTIRGEGLTVLQAISRQLTHYAYHVGQVVYVSKHFAGSNWKSLSIPLGRSKAFNEAPKKYVEEK